MKGLIIKDLLNLKKNLNTVIVLIIFYALIGYTSSDPSMLIAMISLVLTMMTMTTMSYDDLAKWDKYALTMPVSRKSIVLSKYILSIFLALTGIIISTVIAFVLMNLKNYETSNLMIIAYSIFLISLVFSSIILPLIFKFGVEKSRLMMMAAIGIPIAITYLLYRMGIELPDEEMLLNLLKFSPVITIIVVFISFCISYSIYKKKDI
jgi:ABC-type transport system involved in multi-copper enzyme maturation permease subunit